MHAALLVPLAMLLTTAAPEGSNFGAVATSPMPSGSLALYVMGGYPEVRGGFRQGFGGFELGAETGLDYLLLKADAAATVRAPLYSNGPLRLSVDGLLGGFLNNGSQFDDVRNARAAGLRFGAGTTLSYYTGWPVALYANFKMPMELPLTNDGLTRLQALLGGGAEFALTKEYSIIVGGAAGPEYRRPTMLNGYARLAMQLSIGVGYRLF